MTVIHSVDEIPQFASEAEEHAFWGTHDLSEELWDSLPPVPEEHLPPVRPDTYSVGVRMTAAEIERLKALAAKRNMNHKWMATKWVLERLEEEEKREDCSAAEQP